MKLDRSDYVFFVVSDSTYGTRAFAKKDSWKVFNEPIESLVGTFKHVILCRIRFRGENVSQ